MRSFDPIALESLHLRDLLTRLWQYQNSLAKDERRLIERTAAALFLLEKQKLRVRKLRTIKTRRLKTDRDMMHLRQVDSGGESRDFLRQSNPELFGEFSNFIGQARLRLVAKGKIGETPPKVCCYVASEVQKRMTVAVDEDELFDRAEGSMYVNFPVLCGTKERSAEIARLHEERLTTTLLSNVAERFPKEFAALNLLSSFVRSNTTHAGCIPKVDLVSNAKVLTEPAESEIVLLADVSKVCGLTAKRIRNLIGGIKSPYAYSAVRNRLVERNARGAAERLPATFSEFRDALKRLA